MVARLKLKGIDGRAPPGVKIAAVNSAPKSSNPTAFYFFILSNFTQQ